MCRKPSKIVFIKLSANSTDRWNRMRIFSILCLFSLVLPMSISGGGSFVVKSDLFQELVSEIKRVDSGELIQKATYGQKVVAAVIVAEAANEGNGMVAVAEVIRTRADKDDRTPLGIVKRRHQFSCLNSTTPELLLRKMKRHPQFGLALLISRVTYNEPHRLSGYSKGANHYHATWIKKPFWAQGIEPVVTIGRHAFYRI